MWLKYTSTKTGEVLPQQPLRAAFIKHEPGPGTRGKTSELPLRMEAAVQSLTQVCMVLLGQVASG